MFLCKDVFTHIIQYINDIKTIFDMRLVSKDLNYIFDSKIFLRRIYHTLYGSKIEYVIDDDNVFFYERLNFEISPLNFMRAVNNGSYYITNYILKNEKKLINNIYKTHPIIIIAKKGYIKLYKLFRKYNVDLNIVDSRNQDAIYYAFKFRHDKLGNLIMKDMGIKYYKKPVRIKRIKRT